MRPGDDPNIATDVRPEESRFGGHSYSLAAVVRQHLPEAAGWDITIRGVDVNTAMIAKARRGRYSSWSLRETPEEFRRRWFCMKEREFELDESLRAMVTFEQRNLADDDEDLWSPEACDIVFCRNVMMYSTLESVQALVGRITRALVPRGYLFLGHAETLRGLSQDYQLCHTHGTFYCQRKDTLDSDHRVVASSVMRPQPAPSPPMPGMTWAATWIETIQRSAARQ